MGSLNCENDNLNLREGSFDSFQKILKERKAERKLRAAQKQKEDAKRIEDMNSITGVHPYEQFPAEIWMMILKKLGPDDKRNMWFIHNVFSKLLAKGKIQDIALPQSELLRLGMAGINLETEADDVPRPLAQYTRLRSVCKSMRDAIDEYFEKNLLDVLQLRKKDLPTLKNECNVMPTMIHNMRNYGKTRQMIDKYFDCAVNEMPKRLFIRSMDVTFSPLALTRRAQVNFRPVYERYRDDIFYFLFHVGDQILHFGFHCDELEDLGDNGLFVSELYENLCNMLRFMPNLKWLEVDFASNGVLQTEEESPASWKKPEKLPILHTKPLSKLDSLERIDFSLRTGDQHVYNIYDALVTANPHIKILKYSGIEPFTENINTDLIHSLNLEAFIMDYFDIDYVEPILNFNWKLNRMNLQLDADDTTVQYIFRIVEKFPTLEYLNLSITDLRVKEEVGFLKLPNLKHFEMKLINPKLKLKYSESINFFFSLQFLLYCSKMQSFRWTNQSLEWKKIQADLDKNLNTEKMIDFGSHWKDLRKSNIWDIFPSLEHVVISFIEQHPDAPLKHVMNEYRNRTMVYSESEWDT